MTFFIWVLNGDLQQTADVRIGLARYTAYIPLGASIGGATAVALYLLGARRELAWLTQASCLLYLAFLKFAGIPFVPWMLGMLTTVVTMVAIYSHRKEQEKKGSSVFLLHVMGSIAGLYLSFHMQEFLSGWEPFKSVATSIWALAAGPG
jgi:hypothetical protein